MAGSPDAVVGEMEILPHLRDEDRYYVDTNQSNHSSGRLVVSERVPEPILDHEEINRYQFEDDREIILDEDFLLTLGDEEEIVVNGIVEEDFSNCVENSRVINEGFSNRPTIIDKPSITTYQIHSHERQHAESTAKNTSREELKRNDLNRAHQQLSHLIQRNTLFKPVIPVITEDSGEERSSPLDEIVVRTAKHQGVSKVGRISVESNHHRQNIKGTMDTVTTTPPQRRSSICISEISSDDEDSISSGEDAEMMKQYQASAAPSRILPAAKSITTRRHSIASSSVDHLEQILSLLKKTALATEEEEEPESKFIEHLEDSSKNISLPAPSKGKEKALEWIEDSDFANTHCEDDMVKDENDINANILQQGRVKPTVQRKPFRRFSIDVSSMSNMDHMVGDPLFAREILHQKIINLASSQDSIDEKEESNNTPPEKISEISRQRTRRLSIGNGNAPTFHPITKRKSEPKMNASLPSPRQSAFRNFQGLRDGSKISDDNIITGTARHPDPARGMQRRSSWVCTGAHPSFQTASARVTLLKESSYSDDAGTTERPEVKDPYRLTLHFISDPKQSKKLKSLLRPLTHSVAPKLKLFNYVDRSERIVVDNKDPDVMAIPALAIMVFLQEEQGIERILSARQYLKEEPWQLHHKDLVGGNVVPYPTNNQDFYSHADGLPLWAVRQILGKDRLRFMIFVSHDNWDDTVSLYSKILSRDVQFQKEGFCYFLVFCCKKLNIEVQLALKRLPRGFVPTPLDAALLQFKVQDMGQLVPLLPRVCSPISAKRWQTTDLDGNKILLLVHHESGNLHRDDDVETQQMSGKSSPNSDGDISSTSETNCNFKDISNYV